MHSYSYIMFTLFIKGLEGKTYTITIEDPNPLNTTVAQLKEKIAIRTGIKAENQQLIYINKYMQDTHTLAHYETLGNESNIFLVMRLLGGGNTQSSNEPATGGQVQSTPTTCKLFIIAFERNTYEVTINNPETITVEELKELISDKTGVESPHQKLIYNGRIMNDSETIKNYPTLENGSRITMGLRGMNSPVNTSLPRSDEECLITYRSYKDNGTLVLKMPCGHSICPDGLMDYVWAEVSRKKTEVKCLHCFTVWPFKIIKEYGGATRAELVLLEQALSQNFCDESDNINQCPKCQSYFTRVNPSVNSVKCIVCSKSSQSDFYFCWHCLGEWKSSLSSKVCGNDCMDSDKLAQLSTCDQVGFSHFNIKIPSLRACPSCGSLIELVGDLKYVNCKKCKTDFCFICLRIKTNGMWLCGDYETQCECAPRQTKIPQLS